MKKKMLFGKLGSERQETMWIALALILLALIATLPYFNLYLVNGHDLPFHLARIEGIYHSMASGHKLVRINPIQTSGYGYASGILYPQLFLYFPALLRFLHVSLMDAYKIFIFLINLATAAITYISIRKMTGRRMTGLLCAAFYMLSIYRLSNIYSRGALGEVLAMAFLPMVVYGMHEVLQEDSAKWGWLMLGYTGIIQSHILSALMTAFFCMLATLLSAKRLLREKERIGRLVLAAAVTIALNAWFLIPFLEFYRLDLNSNLGETGIWKTASSFSQMFTNNLPANIGLNLDLSSTKWEMIQSVGIILIFAGCMFAVRPYRENESREGKQARKEMEVLFGFAILSIWMSSTLFPWETLSKAPIMDVLALNIQFAWRFLGYAALFLCITGAEGVSDWISVYAGEEKTVSTYNKKRLALLLTFFAIVGNCHFFLDSTTQMDALEVKQDCASVGLGGSDELYLYRGDHIYKLEQRAGDFTCSEGTAFSYTDYKRYGCKLLVHINIEKAVGDSYIEAPLYYYPGYKAWMNGQEATLLRGTDGVIRIPVSEGSWDLKIDFVEAPFWIAGNIVSAVTFLLILAIEIKKGVRRQRLVF